MAIVNINESVNGTPLEGAFAFVSEHVMLEVRTNDAVIKPGRLCTRDGSDRKVKLPTTVAEVLACRGVTELTDTQKLNSSGEYPAGTRLSVVRKGVLYMKCVTACTQGGDVFVYYGSGDATLRGRVGGSFSSGQNVKLPGAKFFETQATPDGMVAVEFDLPGDTASNSPQSDTLAVAVHYESTGTTWDFVGGVQPSGVTITDVGVGVFRLTVAGATSVYPLGQPVLKLATPISAGATGGVAVSAQVVAITATTIDIAIQSQQTDDQLFDVLDLADNDIVYVGLKATY